MYLECFSDNPFGTDCWLISADGSDEAVVVDPGFYPDRVEDLLRRAGKRPAAVLATHGHLDHIGSAPALCADSVPFYIHESDRLAITDHDAWGAGYPAAPVDPIEDVRTLVEGDVLDVAGLRIEVMHTPGHTQGSRSVPARREGPCWWW